MDERTATFERALAYHEAGHAAIDIYFDHMLEMVTINQDGDAGGYCATDRAGHDAMRYEDETVKQVPFERWVMTLFAGEIAQRKFDATSVDIEHAASDRRAALDYLEELDCRTEEIVEAYSKVLELRAAVLVDMLWPKIIKIAEALLSNRTLTGEEAEAIFVGREAES